MRFPARPADMIQFIRRRWAITFFLATAILILLYEHKSIAERLPLGYYTRTKHELLDEQGNFWRLLHKDLIDHGPNTEPLVHPEDTDLSVAFNNSVPRKRPDLLTMKKAQLAALGEAHQAFVNKIRALEYRLPYKAKTRGIVTTAGVEHLPVALTSIRMLRETGSQLPVEVFLAEWSEWDPVICSKILPKLNAKCLVLQDIFDYEPTTKENGLGKYQYKAVAILFSSFQDVLFLDSDCFPLHQAESLFDQEPFKSTGLVLWPDFWYPSESPLFFEIAGIQAPPVEERSSTEAGEILYSKDKHELGLLLATYYNYHGPDFYYPLQSQGAPGEGDKETFIWSAVVLGEPYYTVKHPVKAMGYLTKNGDWRGSAMAQFDPIQDHAAEVSMGINNAQPYFAHVNFPKLDPGRIFESMSFGATGPTRDSDGTMRRIWHDTEASAIEFFGFDIERRVWEVVLDIACEYEGQFMSWKGKRDICKSATEYWEAVFE